MLSADGARKLRRLEAARKRAAESYAHGLAELASAESHAAIARELGISRQALHDRLRTHRTEDALGPQSLDPRYPTR